MIPNTQSIITLSGKGYIKRMATAGFSVQQRGGKGKAGGNFAGNDDTLNQAMQVYAHDALLFFARNGKVFSVGAHEIPETARNRQGMSVPQLVKGLSGAAITTVLPVSSEAEAEEHLIMATRKGTLKRMVANEFSNIQASGRVAIKLAEGDSLDFVQGGGDGDTLLLATATGMVMHTDILADQLRPMGRTARGVKGITMDGDDRVVGMAVVPEELRGSKSGPWLLFVTKEGQGKCVRLSSFTTQRRGGRGRIGLKFNDGDGLAAMHLLASRDAEVMIATSGGLVNKCKAMDIPMPFSSKAATSDPYVVIKVAGRPEKKTRTRLATLSPVWNEVFAFDLHHGVDVRVVEAVRHDVREDGRLRNGRGAVDLIGPVGDAPERRVVTNHRAEVRIRPDVRTSDREQQGTIGTEGDVVGSGRLSQLIERDIDVLDERNMGERPVEIAGHEADPPDAGIARCLGNSHLTDPDHAIGIGFEAHRTVQAFENDLTGASEGRPGERKGAQAGDSE